MVEKPTRRMANMAAQTTKEKVVVPFILSLVGGLLILVGGGMMVGFARFPFFGGMMGGYYGMMSGYYGLMGGYGGGWFYAFSVIEIISGILVLIGAIMLYNEPSREYTWGILILVFSVLSFFGMGGFMLGALLGVVGGVLALTWKST